MKLVIWVNISQRQMCIVVLLNMLSKHIASFNTRSKAVIYDCQVHFHFDSISDITAKRKRKFLNKYKSSDNSLCSVVCSI